MVTLRSMVPASDISKIWWYGLMARNRLQNSSRTDVSLLKEQTPHSCLIILVRPRYWSQTLNRINGKCFNSVSPKSTVCTSTGQECPWRLRTSCTPFSASSRRTRANSRMGRDTLGFSLTSARANSTMCLAGASANSIGNLGKQLRTGKVNANIGIGQGHREEMMK